MKTLRAKFQYCLILVIGGYGGTRQVIRKTVEGDDLFEKVQLKELIPADKQTRVLIQMTTGSFISKKRFDHGFDQFHEFSDGLLEVFVGELQYKPIIKASAKPIDVKYVSFASNDGSRVLFFYNCDDEKAAKSILPVPAASAHPLFADAIERNEETLAKKCKHYHAWEDKYTTPIKLESIKNSKPDGFAVRLPVLVKGVRDVHILLTPGSLSPKDGYEIGNTKIL